jgi:hypothetical protein
MCSPGEQLSTIFKVVMVLMLKHINKGLYLGQLKEKNIETNTGWIVSVWYTLFSVPHVF